MSIGVFLAVLFAALLHAGWNALLKGDGDKERGMFAMSTTQGLMGLALALALPLPQGAVWPWLVASAGVHSFYKAFLAGAYAHGDLSRVYPIARGTAPMLVAVAGALLLPDRVTAVEYLGILLVAGGILLMAHGVFAADESLRLLPFALATAVMTAGYTVIDGIGVRIGGDAGAYVGWLFFLDGVFYGIWAGWRQGARLWRGGAPVWVRGTVVGGASFAAYWVVVWAMARAPVAVVAALRETSVLFAVLIGILFFGERAGPAKLLAAGAIALGVALVRMGSALAGP